MPLLTRHSSPARAWGLVINLALAFFLLAATLPVAASAPAGGGEPTGYPAAAATTPAVSGTQLAPTVPITGSAAAATGSPVTATATLAPPPAVSVTPAPSATPAATAVYPPIMTSSGVPRFEQGPCAFNLPAGAIEGKDVRCGTLVVLEEHADPSSPTLQIAVAIVPAKSPHPLADPVVFNQGGPGFGSIDTYLPFMLNSPFRTNRDQITFDQRGTGYSKPALLCPEVISETIATLDQDLSPADSNAQYNAAALLCRDRLVHAGVNLSAYNTQENAADIADLRQALGYPPLNLYGVSYGSLLVLDTLRFFPGSVRSAIVDGVVPPQGNMNTDAPRTENRAFIELFNDCASEAACNDKYPHLSDVFFNLVAQLNDHPATIHLIDPDTGQTYAALLTGDGLIGAVFQAMYESDVIPAIPEIIRRATLGDYAALEPIVALIDLNRQWSIGMYWSVYCAENADFNPAAITYTDIRKELAKGQDANNQAIKALCQAWNVRDLSKVLNTPVTSTVPTLLLNGRFDPITPPSNGLLVSQALTHSTDITITNTAHGAFSAFRDPVADKCVNDMMSAFVDHPELDVDTRCLDNLPPVDFVTPGNLVNFSVVGLANALAARRPGLLLGVLALLLAVPVLLSSLIVLPIAWLLKSRGDPPEADTATMLAGANPAALAGGVDAAALMSAPPKPDAGLVVGLAPWLAVLCGLLPLAFVAAFILTVGPLFRNSNGILLVGLPGSVTWVFLLPVVNAVIVLLLVLASLLGLVNKDWSSRRKLYYLLLSLAGLTLVVGLGLVGVLTALLPLGGAFVKGNLGI